MIYRLASLAAVLLGTQVAAFDFEGLQRAPIEPGSVVAADAYNTKPTDHVQYRIRSGNAQARAVNLGSWLVAEKWMTDASDIWQNAPQEKAAHGEFQVMKHGNNVNDRRSRFENHHNTFVMEKDIKAIADAGLNTVRVPVGYWITGDDPFDLNGAEEWKTYPGGTVKYLDRLIKEWAVTHNIAVLISIHGAKGSQNGADHSAAPDPQVVHWSSYPENVNNTIYVAEWLAKRYKDEPAFLGIGLLNEPNNGKNSGVDEGVLNNYYERAYKKVRETGTDCVLTIMPLLFKQDATNLNGFMEAPNYTNVWVEWHPYFIWGYENVAPDQLISKAILTDFQNKVQQWNNRPGSNRLFFGEWSLASSSNWLRDPNSDIFKQWTQAQVTVMNQAKGGWAYWSWRVYGDDHNDGGFNAWSMRNVLSKEPLARLFRGQ